MVRKLLKWSVFAVLGWLIYLAGSEDVFSGLFKGNNQEVARKVHAIKPRIAIGTNENVEPAAEPPFDFTFFDTLKDAELVRYVDLNGKVVKRKVDRWMDEVEDVVAKTEAIPKLAEKVDALFETSKAARNPQVSFPQPRKIENSKSENKKTVPISQPAPVPAVPASGSQFLVQVSSYREARLAINLEADLRKKGFSAFVTTARVAGKEGQWHRVYLGRFANMDEAQKAVQKARQQYNLSPIVLKVTS